MLTSFILIGKMRIYTFFFLILSTKKDGALGLPWWLRG